MASFSRSLILFISMHLITNFFLYPVYSIPDLTINAFTEKPDVIVDINGSGNFTRISEAIEAAPNGNAKRYVIYVKKGFYNEYLQISPVKQNIVLIGDGMGQTVISGNHSMASGFLTGASATLGIDGAGFMAMEITIENTAAVDAGQAVAVRSDSDQSVFYKCEIKGYQDTLFASSNRQFYRECNISGTVDFIFGDATVVFQNCNIISRQRDPGLYNTITAQSRGNSTSPTGMSFHRCNVIPDQSQNATQVTLGRPWFPFARVVFMDCFMDAIVKPEGWSKMRSDDDFEHVFYGEYGNNGAGANRDGRVKGVGILALSETQAQLFTVSKFIGGDEWLPATGVTFTSRLIDV